MSIDLLVFALADSWYSNRCLSAELASHLCCHFSNTDSVIADFTSSSVTASITHDIFLVSYAPYLAILSVIFLLEFLHGLK